MCTSAESKDAVESMGWQAIFDKYDADQSGELDPEEFVVAVRTECKLSEAAVSPPATSPSALPCRFLTMRVELIGHFNPCMTEIYLQI